MTYWTWNTYSPGSPFSPGIPRPRLRKDQTKREWSLLFCNIGNSRPEINHQDKKIPPTFDMYILWLNILSSDNYRPGKLLRCYNSCERSQPSMVVSFSFYCLSLHIWLCISCMQDIPKNQLLSKDPLFTRQDMREEEQFNNELGEYIFLGDVIWIINTEICANYEEGGTDGLSPCCCDFLFRWRKEFR